MNVNNLSTHQRFLFNSAVYSSENRITNSTSQRLFLVLKESACKISFFSFNFRTMHVAYTQRNCNHNICGWIVNRTHFKSLLLFGFCKCGRANKSHGMVNYFAFFVDFAFYLCVRFCARVCFIYALKPYVGWQTVYMFFFHSIARIRLFCCCCQFLCVVDLISG